MRLPPPGARAISLSSTPCRASIPYTISSMNLTFGLEKRAWIIPKNSRICSRDFFASAIRSVALGFSTPLRLQPGGV